MRYKLHERRPAANAAAVTTLKISTGNWFHMVTTRELKNIFENYLRN